MMRLIAIAISNADSTLEEYVILLFGDFFPEPLYRLIYACWLYSSISDH